MVAYYSIVDWLYYFTCVYVFIPQWYFRLELAFSVKYILSCPYRYYLAVLAATFIYNLLLLHLVMTTFTANSLKKSLVTVPLNAALA